MKLQKENYQEDVLNTQGTLKQLNYHNCKYFFIVDNNIQQYKMLKMFVTKNAVNIKLFEVNYLVSSIHNFVVQINYLYLVEKIKISKKRNEMSNLL